MIRRARYSILSSSAAMPSKRLLPDSRYFFLDKKQSPILFFLSYLMVVRQNGKEIQAEMTVTIAVTSE
jgi:hypothetical protein